MRSNLYHAYYSALMRVQAQDVVVPPASFDEYAFLEAVTTDGESYSATLQRFRQAKHHSSHGIPVSVASPAPVAPASVSRQTVLHF